MLNEIRIMLYNINFFKEYFQKKAKIFKSIIFLCYFNYIVYLQLQELISLIFPLVPD